MYLETEALSTKSSDELTVLLLTKSRIEMEISSKQEHVQSEDFQNEVLDLSTNRLPVTPDLSSSDSFRFSSSQLRKSRFEPNSEINSELSNPWTTARKDADLESASNAGLRTQYSLESISPCSTIDDSLHEANAPSVDRRPLSSGALDYSPVFSSPALHAPSPVTHQIPHQFLELPSIVAAYHSLNTTAAAAAVAAVAGADPFLRTIPSNCSGSVALKDPIVTVPNIPLLTRDNAAGVTSGHFVSSFRPSLRRKRTAPRSGGRKEEMVEEGSPPPQLPVTVAQMTESSGILRGTDYDFSGDNCGRTISRNSERSLSEEKDPAYLERRRKNNEAAKRSRDARRQKEEEIAYRAAKLEQENISLKAELLLLRRESAELHHLLYGRVDHPQR